MTASDPAAADHAWLDQDGFDVRLEWGPQGLRRLAPLADVVIVVDVLSFTTAVTIALESGVVVLPYRWAGDDDAARAALAAFAEEHEALVAAKRGQPGPSLSPPSLSALAPGTRLVLPSPNGSALSFGARDHGAGAVAAACLRNATAVARWAAARHGVIAVVPAGERWPTRRGRGTGDGSTGPMRVAVEDLLGAGAVVAGLPSALRRSPEAAAAEAAFLGAIDQLYDRLATSPSGRQLLAWGFGSDVLVAGAHDVTDLVPTLRGAAFVAA